VKPIIWHGEQYRLANPRAGSVASMLYVNEQKTEGVIFNYLVNYRYEEGSKYPIKMAGLDAAKKYQIKEINLFPGKKSTIDSIKTYTGDFLMKVGFNPNLNNNRTSVVLKLEEAK